METTRHTNGMGAIRAAAAEPIQLDIPPSVHDTYQGRHRRTQGATDRALCAYRDDAEAIHGTYYYGTHAGDVSMTGLGLRQLAVMAELGAGEGRLVLSRQLNGRS